MRKQAFAAALLVALIAAPASAQAQNPPPPAESFEKVVLDDFAGRADEPRRAAGRAGAAHDPGGRGADVQPAHRAEHARGRARRLLSTTRRGSRASRSTRTSRRNRWVYAYYSPPRQHAGRRSEHAGDQRGRRAARAARRRTWAKFKGEIQLSPLQAQVGDKLDMKHRGEDPRRCRSTAASAATSAATSTSTATGNLLPVHGRRHEPVLVGRLRADRRLGRTATRSFDARRSAGNTNDLRGKILRIRPKDGGGYTIPQGNLFRAGHGQDQARDLRDGPAQPVPVRASTATTATSTSATTRRTPTRANPLRGPGGPRAAGCSIKKPANYGWPYCVTPTHAVRRLRLRHQDLGRGVQLQRADATTRRTTPA